MFIPEDQQTDRVALKEWIEHGTICNRAQEENGLAQEIRDAIPDHEMPEDFDRALFRYT